MKRLNLHVVALSLALAALGSKGVLDHLSSWSEECWFANDTQALGVAIAALVSSLLVLVLFGTRRPQPDERAWLMTSHTGVRASHALHRRRGDAYTAQRVQCEPLAS